jgi:hypothetical protein
MSEKEQKPKVKTEGGEWIGIAVIIILAVIAALLLFFWLKPQLFSGSKYEPPGPPSTKVVCPTSAAPTGLAAAINDVSKPTFDASWIPITSAFTTGQTILGYHIYVSESPNITVTNTTSAYTPTPQVRVTKAGGSKLVYGKTYYFRVATLDTCGLGEISTEEVSITI